MLDTIGQLEQCTVDEWAIDKLNLAPLLRDDIADDDGWDMVLNDVESRQKNDHCL